MRRLPSRLLVVAASIPPDPTGGAVVLGRMLRGVDPRDYRLASFERPTAPSPGEPLPVPTLREVRRWMPREATSYRLRGIRLLRALCLEAYGRARRILQFARGEECRGLLAITGSAPDLLAGALASRISGLPLAVWFQDPWRHQNHRALRVPGAGMWLEGAIVRSTRVAIVTNDRQRELLATEHGCRSVVVRNPIEPLTEDRSAGPAAGWPADPQSPKIVYTGQLYAVQLDAVARLVEALEAPALQRWTFHVHGSTTPLPGYLRRPRVVVHPVSEAAQTRAIQRTADINFLPLAFTSPYPELIASATPAKLGEYLASGRPILVHAPPATYLAELARRERFAEVVDEPAPEQIVDAILRIAGDAQLRRDRAERAALLAAEFSLAASTARFDAALAAVLDAHATADPQS